MKTAKRLLDNYYTLITKKKIMNIETGKTYYAAPLLTAVRAIAPTTRRRNQPMWEVEALTGPTKGQRLDIPASSLAVKVAVCR